MFPAPKVDASKVVGASPSPVTVWDSRSLRQFRNNPQAQGMYHAIDELGRGSIVAQGLKHVLTSCERLHDNPTHRLYLLAKGRDFIGILKVGTKKLFIRTKTGELKEIDPLCVLDFYVVESEQRSGHGRLLYDTMLEREQVQPHQLGYDKPSPKFLGFLRKHFGLSDFIPQTNNFVVFEQYFSSRGAHTAPAAPPVAASRTAAPHVAAHGRPVAAASGFGLAATTPAGGHDDGVPRGMPPAPIPLNRPLHAQLPSKPAAASTVGARVPATSAALAASLPGKRTGADLGSSVGRRNQSPTRSGAGYNIITCADEDAAAVASPQPLGRSYGRR